MENMITTEDVAQHYSRKAKQYGYDVRACEYRGKGPFACRQKMLIDALGNSHGKVILDVGCGTGSLASPLVPGNTVVGVDISSEMLGLASASHRPALARGEALPFLDSVFDAVLGIEVLQHVRNLRPFVAEMTRVVKPAGAIVLTMIHSRSCLQRAFRAFGLSPQMYQWHSAEEIASQMGALGWYAPEWRFVMMPSGFAWKSPDPRHPFDFFAAAWMACFCKKGAGQS